MNIRGLIAVFLLALATGCGAGSMSKEDMMTKLKDAQTGDDVRKALGKPDGYEASEVPIVGKTESLTYNGKDGNITVILLNNKVVTKATEKPKKDK